MVVGAVIGFGQLCAIDPGIAAAFPTVAPSAPGNVAKKLSKLRFSWITITTCLIGVPPPVRCSGRRPPGRLDGAPPAQETAPASSASSIKMFAERIRSRFDANVRAALGRDGNELK